MKNDYYTRLNILEGFILVCLLISFVALYSCIPAHAGVSNGQPVSAAVTNAAFMDKNTATTFTIALTDIQGGIETKSAADSTSTGSLQIITLSAPITIFTNAGLTSIENLIFASRSDATLATIRNLTGGTLTLKNLTGGVAANQIDTGIGSDLALANDASVNLFYNTVSSKWQVITAAGADVNLANLNGILGPTQGGTGSSSFAQGAILNASATNTWSATSTPTLGISGTTTGTLSFAGSGSGAVKIKPQAAAGTWEFDFPITAGNAGDVLTSQGGAGTAMTWTTPSTITPTGVLAYNYLVNGAFDYWQVGTSTTVADTFAFQADQWLFNGTITGTGNDATFTYSRVTGSIDGSRYGAQVQVTTGANGTQTITAFNLIQTLSNLASQPLYNQTGSFAVQIKALGNVNQVGLQFYYATSETEASSAIGSEVLTSINTSGFTNVVIDGQALGTSMTKSGVIGIKIRPSSVSSGHLGDLNNGIIIEQAIMNVGATHVAFSRQHSDPQGELEACQYFYQKSYNMATAPGTNTGAAAPGALVYEIETLTSGTGTMAVTVPWKVRMRANPTVTAYSSDGTSGKCRDKTNSTNITPAFSSVGEYGAVFALSPSSASTVYYFECEWVADARI